MINKRITNFGPYSEFMVSFCGHFAASVINFEIFFRISGQSKLQDFHFVFSTFSCFV